MRAKGNWKLTEFNLTDENEETFRFVGKIRFINGFGTRKIALTSR